jgi:hypothetical protein
MRPLLRNSAIALLLAVSAAHAELEIKVNDKPAQPAIAVPDAVNDGQRQKPRRRTGGHDDVMLFKNGDILHGALLKVTPESVVHWQHPDMSAPVQLAHNSIRGIKLGSAGEQEAKTQSYVRLTNGDALYGAIVGLDDATMTFDTWYAGQLKVERVMIQSVVPGTKTHVIYKGPQQLDAWTQQGQWNLVRGRLQGTGSVGKDLKLPDMASIKWDVEYAGGHPSYQMCFYTNNVSNYHQGESYMLNVSSYYVTLQRYSPNRGSTNLGQKEDRSLMQKRKYHAEMLVNKKAKTLALLIDGKLINQWTDTQDFVGKGAGVVIYSSDRNSGISFGNISVAHWDGKVRTAAETDELPEDIITFVNEDKVSGKLEGIADGAVKFTTPYATMDVPITRVSSIRLGTENAERARRNKTDAEFYFPNGERLTLALSGLDQNAVTGSSENFGDAKLDLSAFIAVRFNIYDFSDDAGVEAESAREAADLLNQLFTPQ